MQFPVNTWPETAAFPVLTTMTLIPLAAMIAVLCTRSLKMALQFGFVGTSLTVLLSLYLLAVFDAEVSGMNLVEQVRFAGMSYTVGVDGVNILFIPLTAVIAFLVLLYTFSHAKSRYRDRFYVASVLGYETVLIGAFVSLNVMQFWLWSVLEMIPVVYLTLHSGTGQCRRWAVDRFLQYWLSGLSMTLTGFLLLAFGLIDSEHPLTFDWLTIKQNSAYLHDEALIFVLLFYGFAVRMPLFPFHGWLPILAEHGTVASCMIFLVGLKLGVFAILRFILPILPGVAEDWAGLVLALAVLSIFYGAIMALLQINIRRLLAFAVLSQTGILVIGLFCFNNFGLEGSIMLSVAYGLATAGMLFSVGLIYERTGTAIMPRLGGLFDSNLTLGMLFLVSALSTLVKPGTPGFDATHLIIEGTIEEHGWLLAIAILTGNLLAAAFILWAFQRVFLAGSRRFAQPYSSLHHPVLKERLITAVICVLLVGTGFYMRPWLRLVDQDASMITKGYPIHSSMPHGPSAGSPQSGPFQLEEEQP
ncbi:complex I subunit 4 family protein [Methylomicrobium sp. RS1]|jgi:NADH-quinone oxidoreductase subunit M|uniref:complex I subunit 4 family protein n=1 Tax=Candidatus Methylomicrobium oryzae TaxID=2802053 RepID=UPI001921D215|nr:NADH-quinone oxidoreductase subunit M [Methylomicrobium sp. RS1]MBL1265404.1 NADH-quinone oxidoreductase subunit M [Methylomicrobium sp. RS1]